MKEMNELAVKIGMDMTNYINPHGIFLFYKPLGMSAYKHKSSAYDQALLCAYAVKNDKFMDIVSTVKHKALI